MNFKQETKIKEYEFLCHQISDWEKRRLNIFIACYTIIPVLLLSGQKLQSIFKFPSASIELLLILCMVIFIMGIYTNHILEARAYIHVFHENEDSLIRWETRNQNAYPDDSKLKLRFNEVGIMSLGISILAGLSVLIPYNLFIKEENGYWLDLLFLFFTAVLFLGSLVIWLKSSNYISCVKHWKKIRDKES